MRTLGGRPRDELRQTVVDTGKTAQLESETTSAGIYHPMRVLAITKVFPNAIVPLDEPHIRQQYAALSKLCEVEVLASIPWFPGLALMSRYSYAGRVAGAPRHEVIDGLEVYHPRFFQVPKIGVLFQGLFYAASLLPSVLKRRSRFDVILSTWAYPDGVAAIALGKALGLPVVVEVIGTDINVVAEMPAARANLRVVFPHATRVVAVSSLLGHKVAALGVARDRIDIIPTGVNRSLFYPRDREQARKTLADKLPGGAENDAPLLLYIGRIEREKGVIDLLDAFAKVTARLPKARLVLVGTGDADSEVNARAQTFGGQVIAAGQQPIDAIPDWLAACDVLALPSWAEGTPNVILEALASGRRVVASDVGGIPDLITSELQGELVPARRVDVLSEALTRALQTPYDPQELADSGAVLSWPEAASLLHGSLQQAAATR
jgi:teichuronic acid biosynthesis glycosyltransferase TuaC